MSDTRPAVTSSVPTNESDRFALIFDRPAWWEYALYASVLVDQLQRYESAYRDYEIAYVAHVGPAFDPPEILAMVRDETSKMLKMVENFNVVTSPTIQQRAFGAPGEPGDPELIDHMARRLIDIYGSLLAWAAQLRSARIVDEAIALIEAQVRMVEQPIAEIRRFAHDTVRQMNEALELLAKRESVGDPIHVDLNVTLVLGDDIVAEFQHALDSFGLWLGQQD